MYQQAQIQQEPKQNDDNAAFSSSSSQSSSADTAEPLPVPVPAQNAANDVEEHRQEVLKGVGQAVWAVGTARSIIVGGDPSA
eukprot:gene25066-30277_t